MIFCHDLSGKPYEAPRFPNGELNLSAAPQHVPKILMRWESDEDLVELMLLKKSLKPNLRVTLDIAYMPYSRMDRDADGRSNCSLRYVGEFIQSLDFEHIRVCDPHSDLSLAYLGTKATSYYPFKSFTQDPIFEMADYGVDEDPIIMFPDAGAYKRYAGMPIFAGMEHVIGFKHRDFQTGRITSYHLAKGGVDLQDRTVLIVDDLCSYGYTFVFAGEALKAEGAKRVDLLVTHCEDSIHDGQLLSANSPITNVLTTNSLLNKTRHDKLTVSNLFTPSR